MAENRRARIPQVFAALVHRDFRIFWTWQSISLVGIWMQMMAQNWLVYDLFSSKFLLGLVNTFAGLPLLLLSPLGGIVADHMDKRKLLVFTQVMFALLSFLVGAMVSSGFVPFWAIALVATASGVVNSLDTPVRQAFVVELADKRSLGNAIALNSLAFNVARIIGPALAGYLIGAVGIEFCFYLNALSFIPVLAGMFWLTGDFRAKARMTSSVAESLKDGARYVLDNRKVLYLLILIAISSVFVMPYAVLMPVFAKDILNVGAQGLGTLMAFSGAGALVGALTLAQYNTKIDYRKFILASTITMSAALLAFSFSNIFAVSCALLAVMGWGIVSQAASVNTLIQQEVPNELRGRVMSFYSMSFMGFMPVGAFQAGIISHFIGAPGALAIGAVLAAVPAVFMIFFYKKEL